MVNEVGNVELNRDAKKEMMEEVNEVKKELVVKVAVLKTKFGDLSMRIGVNEAKIKDDDETSAQYADLKLTKETIETLNSPYMSIRAAKELNEKYTGYSRQESMLFTERYCMV